MKLNMYKFKKIKTTSMLVMVGIIMSLVSGQIKIYYPPATEQEWELLKTQMKGAGYNHFMLSDAASCMACMDRDGWKYYSSYDHSSGACCFEKCETNPFFKYTN